MAEFGSELAPRRRSPEDGAGGMDGRTDGWTDVQTDSPCVLQDFIPFKADRMSGALQALKLLSGPQACSQNLRSDFHNHLDLISPSGRLEIHPHVLQDISPLGPLHCIHSTTSLLSRALGTADKVQSLDKKIGSNLSLRLKSQPQGSNLGLKTQTPVPNSRFLVQFVA